MPRFRAETWIRSAGLIIAATACSAAVTAQVPNPPAPAPQQPAAKAAPRPAAPKQQAAPQSPPQQAKAQAAPGGPAFQTLEQLQNAGVKRCLQVAQTLGQATMSGSSQYAAVSTWNNKQPDNRFSVSMIGQQYAAGQNSTPNGLSGVFAVPTPEGKCDAAAVQIIPTTEPCTSVQAQVMAKGRSLGNLAGVPLLQNAANAQVMLLPGANNSCVLVVLSTVYTE